MATYVAPRSTERGILCECGKPMRPEQGDQFIEDGHRSWPWMWWRCTGDANHVTRALPLPVQMARG